MLLLAIGVTTGVASIGVNVIKDLACIWIFEQVREMVHLDSGSRSAFDTRHSAYFRLFDACGLLLLIQTESLISRGKCILRVLCGDSR